MTAPKDIQATLDRPGAGIPLPARLFNRFVLKPLVVRRSRWEANEAQFQRLHSKFLRALETFPREKLTERVLVPPQVGLEDSSRWWSAAMTARHLVIVGQAMEHMIGELSHGRRVAVLVDTAKVKPESERNDMAALEEYRAFGDGVIERLRSKVGDRASAAAHWHPWFGDLRANDWLWLMGVHTAIHLKQLRRIRQGC